MTKVRDNFRVYSDLDCDVFLAPIGTTLPTNLDAPGVGFEDVGWLNENGVPLSREVDVKKFKAYQGGSTLRVKITSDEKSFKFTASEEKPLVSQLYWGHGAATVTTGVAKVTIPESAAVAERAAVLRFKDGGVTKLYTIPRVQITPDGEIAHAGEDGSEYGFAAEILGDFFLVTDAPAFTEAGTP